MEVEIERWRDMDRGMEMEVEMEVEIDGGMEMEVEIDRDLCGCSTYTIRHKVTKASFRLILLTKMFQIPLCRD